MRDKIKSYMASMLSLSGQGMSFLFSQKFPWGHFGATVAKLTGSIIGYTPTERNVMFKNRHLQVRLVKDEQTIPTTVAPKLDYMDKVMFTTQATKTLLREGAKLVGGLIILDTLRKVAITYAQK